MRCLWLLALMTILVPPAIARGQVAAKKGASVEQQVIDIKEQWLAAAQSHNMDFLDKLFAPEFQELSTAGDVLTKAKVFERGRSTHRVIDELSSDVIKVRVYGNVAVLTDRTTIKYHDETGKKFQARLRFVRVLVERRGTWEAVSAHGTPLKD